jgi:hypothetical protein
LEMRATVFDRLGLCGASGMESTIVQECRSQRADVRLQK